MKQLCVLAIAIIGTPLAHAQSCRTHTGTMQRSSAEFAQDCRRETPAGHELRAIGRRVSRNVEAGPFERYCVICPKGMPAKPEPPVTNQCRHFLRAGNSVSAEQFRNLCLQRLPSGYAIQSIKSRLDVNYDGLVRDCNMCPESDVGVRGADRGVSGKSSGGGGPGSHHESGAASN